MASLQVVRYDAAERFLATVQEALVRREAANGLLLGITINLAAGGSYGDDPPLFASVHDGGRMVLAAIRTPPHKLIVAPCDDAPADACEQLAGRFAAERLSLPGVLGPADASTAFARSWSRLQGMSSEAAMRMTVYELRRVVDTPSPDGRLRAADESEVDVLTAWCEAFNRAISSAGTHQSARRVVVEKLEKSALYAWDNGGLVSMAARTRETPGGCAISMVYTPPSERGKGYATACVTGLCRDVLASGKQFCTLYADQANPVSNGIYRRIGFSAVDDVTDYTFR